MTRRKRTLSQTMINKTQDIKDGAPRTQLKTGVELRFSGDVRFSLTPENLSKLKPYISRESE
jgi:hypothetical protein